MQMQEYLEKYDELAFEDALFDIPLRKEYVLDRVGKGKKVLDIGCLGGKMSRLIMEQHNDVWGLEVNPIAAAQAEKRGIRVKVANVEDGIPFEDSSFDVINAGEVIEHLYDTRMFFQETRRVLKKDGVLLLTASNLNSLENRIRVAAGGYLSMMGAYPEDHFGEYVRVFNLTKIKELCEQAQLELVDVSGVPLLESLGKVVDRPLSWLGRAFPSFSKLLMVTAKKR